MGTEVISFVQITGETASPVFTEKTSIKFCTANDPDPQLNNPCRIPPADIGKYYSAPITVALYYSGTFADISNLRIWGPQNVKSSWFNTTAGRVVIARKDEGDHGFLVANYAAPSGMTVGTTAKAIKDATYGHPEYKDETISVVDIDTLTQASPLVIDSRHITSSGSYSKAFLVQAEIYPTAEHGERTAFQLVAAVEVV